MKLKIMSVLRLSAQLIGFQLSVFFLFFLISEGFSGFLEGKFSALFIVILMLLAILGYILSFKKHGVGAWVMIVSSIIMGIYLLLIGGFAEWKMSLIFTLPYLFIGFILLLTAHISHNYQLSNK